MLKSTFTDLSKREIGVLTPLIALVLLLGFFPAPVLDVINPTVTTTMHEVGLTDPVLKPVAKSASRLNFGNSETPVPSVVGGAK